MARKFQGFKSFLVLALALILNFSAFLTPLEAHAEIDEFIDKFAANDITFYNPDECVEEGMVCDQGLDYADTSFVGNALLSGTDMKESLETTLNGFNAQDINFVSDTVSKWEDFQKALVDLQKDGKLKSNVIIAFAPKDEDFIVTKEDLKNLHSIDGGHNFVFVTTYNDKVDDQDVIKTNNKAILEYASDKYKSADWYKPASEKSVAMNDDLTLPDKEATDEFAKAIAAVTDGGGCGGRAVIRGSAADEKVWSGLTSLGFSEEQAAGIMGNMYHESIGFNPAQHEGELYRQKWNSESPHFDLAGNPKTSYGVGLIQWSFGRRINLVTEMNKKMPDLFEQMNQPETYSMENGNVYGCNGDCYIGKVGDDIANMMYSFQLTFLYDEMQAVESYKGIFSQSTVDAAADYFLRNVEKPASIEKTKPDRVSKANEIYNKFKGKSITGSGTSAGSASGSGSSTEMSSGVAGTGKNYDGEDVLTEDQAEEIKKNQHLYEEMVEGSDLPWQLMAAVHYKETNLGRKLSGDPGCNSGACSNGAFQVVKLEYPLTDHLSDEELVKQGQEAIEAEIADKTKDLDLRKDNDVKKFFFRYNGMAEKYKTQARDLGFSEEEANNGEGSPYVMNRFDKERDPKYNQTTWGQIKRDHGPIEYPANNDFGAFVVFQALGGGGFSPSSCGVSNNAGNGDLNATAELLAWKEGESGYYGLDPNDAYRQALIDVGLNTYPDAQVVRGSSCDAFVTTVYRYSGVDEEFQCCGTGSQIAYLESHPEKYEHVSPGTTDTSVLRPGDIMILDGHIKMYIELEGQGKEAQASYASNSGRISSYVSLDDSLGRGVYSIYRFKGGGGPTINAKK